jgi:uncharacterized protein YkwD
MGLILGVAVLANSDRRVTLPVREVVRLHNEVRAKHGLPPVVVDDAMMELAQEHTDWMCETHNVVHSNLDYAENIASGTDWTPKSVVRQWMDSPGHRANILGNYTKIGVGRATLRNRCRCVFYTVIFE